MRKILIDGLLGLVLSAVLLGGVELALAFAGVGATGGGHLSRGFDPAASYIASVADDAGVFRTRYRDDGHDVTIRPKGGRARVLMFGGSNVRGFPVHLLGQRLEHHTNNAFQAVNLGCNGYGSERVAIVVDQALEQLEPDLLVVYTGHNEFTERGFADELESQWGAHGVILGESVKRLRTVRALAGWFSAEPESMPQTGPDAARAVEPRSRPDMAFNRLQYDETLAYFEAFERNLRGICAAARARGVRLVLGTPIYNRFSAPFSYSLPKGATQAAREAFVRLADEARSDYPPYFADLLSRRSVQRVHSKDWGREPSEPFATLDMPGWRACSGPLADFEPSLFGPSGWKPRIRATYAALAALHTGAEEAGERAALERAEAKLVLALEQLPDHPSALFELALVRTALKREAVEVAMLFEQSAGFDRAPRKANGIVHEILRSVAADHPEVLFVDTDALFRERSPMGLVGWEVMIDHCHMNPGAARILMNDLASAIAERWFQ
ncbi:MAG: hypothetical protein GY711_32105 [bacterium]|nr:hypothetical protein [bacterium]